MLSDINEYGLMIGLALIISFVALKNRGKKMRCKHYSDSKGGYTFKLVSDELDLCDRCGKKLINQCVEQDKVENPEED